MTPRTIEEELFGKIQTEKQNLPSFYDLRLGAPLFDLHHPKVLKAIMNHNGEPESFSHPQWKAAFYADHAEAKRYHPEIQKVIRGTPSEIGLFLKTQTPTIVDFLPLGVTVFSQGELHQEHSEGLHRHTLPIWSSYALSPELWGAVGKWTRFHERLHTLFDKFHLLQSEDVPGRYPLKKEAHLLEKYGFKGSLQDQIYVLNLNWTFPLSALEKLEAAVAKEF